jgi:hypothetical protein
MNQATRRTWVSIAIASVIIVGLVALTALGGATFFIFRHVDAEIVGQAGARQEFQSARERFTGQEPLIEIGKDDAPTIRRDLIPSVSSGRRVATLRVLAYDEHSGKVVRIAIPIWLLRLLPSRHLSFLNDQGIDVDIDSERVGLTLDDLERRGPGLVLDQNDHRGSLVLVWVE